MLLGIGTLLLCFLVVSPRVHQGRARVRNAIEGAPAAFSRDPEAARRELAAAFDGYEDHRFWYEVTAVLGVGLFALGRLVLAWGPARR
jgi:hypothetical protein